VKRLGRSEERHRWILFFAFVLITLILLFLHSSGRISTITSYIRIPFDSAQSWFTGRISRIESSVALPGDIASLQAENQELKSRIEELERQNEELLEVYAEYTLLSTLMEYARDNPDYKRVAADIIGWDTSNLVRTIIVNKGEEEGIMPGMAVETERGLVGRVVVTGPHASQVQLLTDTGSSVNSRLGTSRADGVVVGQLNEPMRIKWIDQDIPIFENELVMTSGVGGNFPPDLIIGRVANVRQSASELFQEAEVRPAVDFERLEIVLIITDFQPVVFEQEE